MSNFPGITFTLLRSDEVWVELSPKSGDRYTYLSRRAVQEYRAATAYAPPPFRCVDKEDGTAHTPRGVRARLSPPNRVLLASPTAEHTYSQRSRSSSKAGSQRVFGSSPPITPPPSSFSVPHSLVFSAGQTTERRPPRSLAKLLDPVFRRQSLADAVTPQSRPASLHSGTQEPSANVPDYHKLRGRFQPKDVILQVEPFAVFLDENLILPPRPVQATAIT